MPGTGIVAILPPIPVDAGRLHVKPTHAHTLVTTHVFARERAPMARPGHLPARFDRLTFASGIVSSVVFLVGAVLFIGVIAPQMPSFGSPAEQMATFYREMGRDGIYRTISYLGEMQMMLLLVFFGGLFGVLRQAEDGNAALSFAVFAAGIALAVILPLAIYIEDHLMLGFAARRIDPVIVAAIDGLGPLAFALGGFPQTVILVGTALLLYRDAIVPRPILWFGVFVAVVGLAGTGTLVRGALFPVSSLAMILFRIWLLALSIALFRRAGRSDRVRELA